MDALRAALALVFTWKVLGIILAASVYGTLFGSLPGLTATMAVALVVPITYFLDPVSALGAVIAISACAIFSGDIPSALIRIPGTPASAAYCDDLYALARRGRQQRALGACLTSSVVGGLFGALVLAFFARPMASFATQFTRVEYFWFYLLGLGCAVAVSRGSPLKGALALLLGLLFSTVGLSPVHTEVRFTFGRPELYQGIGFIPAMIGLFGMSEVLKNALTVGKPEEPIAAAPAGEGVFGGTLALMVLRPGASLVSCLIGVFVGILPGAGADIAAWVSYGVSKRISKHPEEYGKGTLEGITDAGAANNSALAGAWVPALVFGIPGDTITALVLGILMMKNLRPGPDLFEDPKQQVLLYSLYVVFFLANLIMIPVGWLAIKSGGFVVRLPRRVLLPFITLFCVLGSFAIGGSGFDVGVMMMMGLLGFALERFQVPLGPVVLGIVLGGAVEEYFIQALTASDGSLGVFFAGTGRKILALSAAVFWGWPLVMWARDRLKASRQPNE